MMSIVQSCWNSVAHLIYPSYCVGCGGNVAENKQILCLNCLYELPETGFTSISDNVVEKMFYGRLSIASATAGFYFTKASLVQHLMHLLKYKSNKEVGIYLGKLLGLQLQQSNRFNSIDVIVPLPLNPKRQFKRGYNQAALIAEGVATIIHKPVLNNVVGRTIFTQTQTTNNRVHRLENMDGVFAIQNNQSIVNKQVLLIDDIITTGATLEACGKIILQQNCAALSIATVAYTA